jgi:hypothetical protein
MRGAISLGPAIFDKVNGVYLGQPIVECARTEKIQDWIGVTLGNSFKNPTHEIGFYQDQVLPYRNAYKEEHSRSPLATGAALDWPRHWRLTRSDQLHPRLEKLNPGGSVGMKYKKTIEFVEFSEAKHDWFVRGEELDWGIDSGNDGEVGRS